MLGHVLVAPFHERADRGWGGVEDGDPVLLDDLPQTVEIREVGGALVHDAGRPVGERAVDDVAVTGDPPDVGAAPIDVCVGLEIEDVMVGGDDPGQIATLGVDDPLRAPGRARGVEDVQRVFCAQDRRLTFVRLALDQVVPPDIPTLGHVDSVVGPLQDDDVADIRSAGQGHIGVGLELDHVSGTPRAVLGDDHPGIGVEDPAGEGVGGEPAEHNRVDQTETSAGQHGDGELGDHAHVDGDPVAFLHAEAEQPVGETAHF